MMKWKKILEASKISLVALIFINIFFQFLNWSSAPSSGQKEGNIGFAIVLVLVSLLLNAIVFLYTGYETVKKYELGLKGAAIVGLVVALFAYAISCLAIGMGYIVRISASEGDLYKMVQIVLATTVMSIYSFWVLAIILAFSGIVLGLIGGFIAEITSRESTSYKKVKSKQT